MDEVIEGRWSEKGVARVDVVFQSSNLSSDVVLHLVSEILEMGDKIPINGRVGDVNEVPVDAVHLPSPLA